MAELKKVIERLEIQLEDLQKYADSDEILTLTQEQAKEIVVMLKEQETVKPKTGHWIEYEGMQGKYYDCSACDYSLMEIHRGMKYCPYCGAKMDNPM